MATHPSPSYSSHSHPYRRQSSTPSGPSGMERISLSPTTSRASVALSQSVSHSGVGMENGTTSPNPRPTPSSRMSLSALVNSPTRSPPPLPTALPTTAAASSSTLAASAAPYASSTAAYTYPHHPTHPTHPSHPSHAGYVEPYPHPGGRSWHDHSDRIDRLDRVDRGDRVERGDRRFSHESSTPYTSEYRRALSPTRPYATPTANASSGAASTYWSGIPNGNGLAHPGGEELDPEALVHDRVLGNGSRGESSRRIVREVVPPPSLAGGEAVWEEALRTYQARREREAREMALYATQPDLLETALAHSVALNGERKPKAKGRATGPRASAAKDAAAGPASGPKKKKSRKKLKAAALDDELLGLAEGENASASNAGRSSPYPDNASDIAMSMDVDEPPQEIDLSPDAIVQPCGLTRAEVIAKIERNDMSGLTENDVKTVQDEMWMRQKDLVGGAPVRKDGTIRKKPGPAKGWKKLRGEPSGGGRRSSSVRGDNDSDAGDTSIAGDTINGEAEADIAALLPEDAVSARKPKAKGGSKKRKIDKLDAGDEGSRMGDGSDEEKPDPSIDDLALSLLEDGTPGGKRKGSKAKEPGVGKGNWKRPTKESKELTKKAEAFAVQNVMLGQEPGGEGDVPIPTTPSLDAAANNPDVLASIAVPNSEDPRGISETEAKVRLGLVEEVQKQVWIGICRDIPRMYRVYQAYDSVVKQDSARKAQAAVRNAFGQRTVKPTFRSVARINKDATSKAKKVIKEMLLYWRKNEKDELVARKKAEKEALDRAKAEEEAREAKRQSRKLNFLLTQTELYSHFIGKKIKTKEAEGEDGEDTAGDEERKRVSANEDLGLDASGEPLPDIDYDDDDEENLRKHAARGAQAAIQAAKDRAKAFDSKRAKPQEEETLDLDGDELNFQNPTLAEDSVTIEHPKMLMAQLKEYQLKGLTWLGNLYEQGINGILADEMGLGKTIQSISLLAYLAEHHNLWGPFLVIAPSSTLHNWQQELARFVPRLKALPYWGSPKDRETLRKIWHKKNMTITEQSPFHIIITSYQLAVQDEKYFQGLRWQYMILDEAQAIKSAQSARWKTLLSFPCRNRLLLTGTPIQNSMHELWALLHFIMPSLFDSHEEFSEWFSKDIENAAGGGSGSLKPEQLRRLHMILKPFMLRRVKKHVQKELGDKIEIDLLVDLSQRQRNIYKALRQRVSISDLIAQANNLTDSLGAKNLMNLVMQFRKVCNHPDLFERADVVSPFVFGTFSHSGNLARQGDTLYCPASTKNAIEVTLPKILWTDGGKLDRPSEESLTGSDTKVLGSLMNIWSAGWISDSLKRDQEGFGWTRLLDVSPGEIERKAKSHPLVSLLEDSEGAQHAVEYGRYESDADLAIGTKQRFPLPPPSVHAVRVSPSLPPLQEISTNAWNTSFLSRSDSRFAVESVVAPFIQPVISDRSYLNNQSRLAEDPLVLKAMYGTTPSERNDPRAFAAYNYLVPGVNPSGILGASPSNQTPMSSMRVPPTKRLVVDSAKLARLDDLLRELKDGGHRVLLYFQMTKMMDLVEEYLIYRQYKYLRLDGSSPIGERRDMVTSWQTNPDIFVFCLSTRAGGLGINLTAADTVIFYDHDWNPSNDAQAMDRAHRVGQTKQVTVYRLIARGTIEERIVTLARAKKDVQDIVVGTKSLTDVAKPSEIVSLFMDDEELAESVAKRKQAEAHGYVAPNVNAARPKSAFGDGLGTADDDEDDFFSLAKKPANGEDEDYGDEMGGSGRNTPKEGGAKKKSSNKRKAPEGGDAPAPKPSKKKVRMGLGPDGLPMGRS